MLREVKGGQASWWSGLVSPFLSRFVLLKVETVTAFFLFSAYLLGPRAIKSLLWGGFLVPKQTIWSHPVTGMWC